MNGSSPGPGPRGPFTNYVESAFDPPIQKNAPSKLPHVPISTADFDSILKTQDYNKVKCALRGNHWPADHEIRKTLWVNLCKTKHGARSSIYAEAVKDVFGEAGTVRLEVSLPSFVDPSNMLHYHLNEKGFHKAKKIMCIIGHTNPDITFGPGIFPMASILLHYMDEEDCYNCLYMLLRSRENYLAQTKISYEAAKFVLKDLTKKYAKSTFQYVHKRGMVVEGVLDNWLWWIFEDLPFSYLVRVVDCYIFEGPKVLYRVALAILKLFHKHQVKGSPNKQTLDVATCIKQFCEDVPITCEELLKTAFGLRGLSRSSIMKCFVRNEMYVRSVRNATNVPQMTKSASYDSLTLKVSRSFFTNESEYINHEQEGKPLARSQSHGAIPFVCTGSTLIAVADWEIIWSWLPTRITLYQPKLIYTTSEHGTSLKTFYKHVDEHEPTLIIIKTDTNQIIGAYCSTEWTARLHSDKSMSYFGTGESFLFKILPKRKKYEWVGKSRGQNIPSSAHLYQAGDNTKITIGGGNGEGLMLDDNLHKGVTQRCDTFNNEPLVDGCFFTCSAMEVFAFQ